METPEEEKVSRPLLLYHPHFNSDLKRIDRAIQKRFWRAVENKLIKNPERFGKPLMRGLYGFWSFRIGDYRLIYRAEKNRVWMIGIIHRRDVYKDILKRIWWAPGSA